MKGNRGRKALNQRNKVGDSTRTNNVNGWNEPENEEEKDIKGDPTKGNKEKANEAKEKKTKSLSEQYEWWELISLLLISLYMFSGSFHLDVRDYGARPPSSGQNSNMVSIYLVAFMYSAAFFVCAYVYYRADSIVKENKKREGNDNKPAGNV